MEKTKGQLNGETKVPYIDGDAYSAITKREYFAGLAMQGLVTRNEGNPQLGIVEGNRIAEEAVYMADALLEALSKP